MQAAENVHVIPSFTSLINNKGATPSSLTAPFYHVTHGLTGTTSGEGKGPMQCKQHACNFMPVLKHLLGLAICSLSFFGNKQPSQQSDDSKV